MFKSLPYLFVILNLQLSTSRVKVEFQSRMGKHNLIRLALVLISYTILETNANLRRHAWTNSPYFTHQPPKWGPGYPQYNYNIPLQQYSSSVRKSILVPNPLKFNDKQASDRRVIQLRRTFKVSEPQAHLPPATSHQRRTLPNPGSSQFPSSSYNENESPTDYEISVSYSMGALSPSKNHLQSQPKEVAKKARTSEDFSNGPWKKGHVFEVIETHQDSQAPTTTSFKKVWQFEKFERGHPDVHVKEQKVPKNATFNQDDNNQADTTVAEPGNEIQTAFYPKLSGDESQDDDLPHKKVNGSSKAGIDATGYAKRTSRRAFGGRGLQSRGIKKTGNRGRGDDKKAEAPQIPRGRLSRGLRRRVPPLPSSPGFGLGGAGGGQEGSSHSSPPSLPQSTSDSGRETETEAKPSFPFDAQQRPDSQSNSLRLSSDVADISSNFAKKSFGMFTVDSWDAKSYPKETEEVSRNGLSRKRRNAQGETLNQNQRRWVWDPSARNYGYGYQDPRYPRSYNYNYNDYYTPPLILQPQTPPPTNPTLPFRIIREGRKLNFDQNVQNGQSGNYISQNQAPNPTSQQVSSAPTYSNLDDSQWQPLVATSPPPPAIPATTYSNLSPLSESLIPLGTYSNTRDAPPKSENYKVLKTVKKPVDKYSSKIRKLKKAPSAPYPSKLRSKAKKFFYAIKNPDGVDYEFEVFGDFGSNYYEDEYMPLEAFEALEEPYETLDLLEPIDEYGPLEALEPLELEMPEPFVIRIPKSMKLQRGQSIVLPYKFIIEAERK